MTSKKKLQNFLHDNGFRCMNQWKISEGEYFTIFQKITDNEIASVLIKDYRDEQGFEVFVNASDSPQIDKDMQAIEERFGLKETLRDSQDVQIVKMEDRLWHIYDDQSQMLEPDFQKFQHAVEYILQRGWKIGCIIN